MPKERTHWHLARRAMAQLTSGPLADAAAAYEEYVLAGAVAHDSGYYRLRDPDAQTLAERLHGNGGHDSFEPFRRLLGALDAEGPETLAFGLGALSHLAADAVFHPIIFSWTGDSSAEQEEARIDWQYRHQACETALDVHLDSLWGRGGVESFRRIVGQCGKRLVTIHSVFSGADARGWLASHTLWQGLFDRPWAARVARWLAWQTPGQKGDWSAAFYPRWPEPHPAFAGRLEWLDPVTGAPGHATLAEVVRHYDEFVTVLATEWSAAWEEHREPFPGAFGPSLDTGLPSDRVRSKRYSQLRWF